MLLKLVMLAAALAAPRGGPEEGASAEQAGEHGAICGVASTASARSGRVEEGENIQVDESAGAGAKGVETCKKLLPGAASFQAVEGKPYVVGLDAQGQSVGWIVRSTDVVDIKGYSGKPLVTLVGVDTHGVITGVKIIHYSEPILLVGIPASKLYAFVDQYLGVKADEKVDVGSSSSGRRTVDAISGATVTALAENQTILDSARALGEDVGVIQSRPQVPGHFVQSHERWSWDQIVDKGALGHLVVTQDQMRDKLRVSSSSTDRPYADIWFGLVDAPQVGIPLLGENTWKYAISQLKRGEHLLAVYNDGIASFKGSGFVRGGSFDRIRIEQGLRTITFRDMDYTRIDSAKAVGAPHFREAALFVMRDAGFDPGAPFEFVFLASTYNGKSGFSRDFKNFSQRFEESRDLWKYDGPDPRDEVWKGAWRTGWPKALGVGLYLVFVAGLFAARRWTTGRMKRLQRIHRTVLTGSLLGLGVWLHVQPSVTQVLTLAGSLVGHLRWSLFLSDPILWVSWIFIAIVTVIWGRGVFCGWICPYGAMNELTFRIGRLLHLPQFELPDRVHKPARYLRYAVLAILLGAFLYQPELGEKLAEVEPFKSTFFVPAWTRHWALFAWWSVWVGWSLFTYRPFCRYLCPLGASLAIASSIRISGPHRRAFCSKCKICTRGCEPRAIRDDGTIDPRECLNCMECEANWRDEYVCPPLVKARRDRERGKVSSLRRTA